MMVENITCMNAGDGATSYANNSFLQQTVILKTRPLLEEAIKDMFSTEFPACFKLADLGCSSGPNTLLVISEILDTVYDICKQRDCKSPEIQVFLNDLPSNDFNTIFKSLMPFYERVKKEKGDLMGPCFISGSPGSFYERLFPSKSLHLFHSSFSVHWLSKVPEGLVNNKGHIFMAKSSPPDVHQAYLDQFKSDFSMFLRSRSEEIIAGGRMVLTLLGRSIEDPTSNDCCLSPELLAKSLLDLVDEGLVNEIDVDSFNLPYYTPSEGELKEIVEMEGSFNLDKVEIFELNWDAREDVYGKEFVFNKYESGRWVSNGQRALLETMLSSRFGDQIINDLFERNTARVAEHLGVEKTKHITMVLNLSKR